MYFVYAILAEHKHEHGFSIGIFSGYLFCARNGMLSWWWFYMMPLPDMIASTKGALVWLCSRKMITQLLRRLLEIDWRCMHCLNSDSLDLVLIYFLRRFPILRLRVELQAFI